MVVRTYFLRRLLMFTILSFSFMLLVKGQDIKVRIKAPEKVEVGEQFKLSYVVESDKEVKESIIIKNIDGFKIIYGPGLSSSNSTTFSNGKRVQSYAVTSTYLLQAERKGSFTLPKGEVVVDGKKYKSESLSIKVGLPDHVKAKKDVADAFIKVIASRNSVNLSDTLTITYRLYTTEEPSRIREANFPSVDAFYASNTTRSRQIFSEEKIKGKTYKVIDLRTLLLQPRSVGAITIPEGEIRLEYSSQTGKQVRDIWGDVYDEAIVEEKVLKIEPLIIRVQDLKEI